MRTATVEDRNSYRKIAPVEVPFQLSEDCDINIATIKNATKIVEVPFQLSEDCDMKTKNTKRRNRS